MACDNLKAPGVNIKVYTVRVINGNADLLRDCATNPRMYYNVQQAERAQQRVLLDRAAARDAADFEVSFFPSPREAGRGEREETYPLGTAHGRSARSFAANASIWSLCCAVRSSSSQPFSSRVLRAGSMVNGTT